MISSAAVRAAARNGRTVFEQLKSDPPLLLRPTPGALHMVGAAAGPVGGDSLSLDVTVMTGATLSVRSVAASLVLPGPAQSEFDIRVRVGEGATLDWAPEPVISVGESSHTQRSVIVLDPSARLRWRELLVLGRSGEKPGELTSMIRVERSGLALTHQELRVGDAGWDGPAVTGGARIVLSELVVGPPPPTGASLTAPDGTRGGSLALASDANLCSILAPSVGSALDMLARLRRSPGRCEP